MTISPDLLKKIILDQEQWHNWPSLYLHRTVEARLDQLGQNKEVVVISGIRCCGKSILMEYYRRKNNGSNDYYFNFEDARLVNFTVEDFEVLHETLISLYGVQKTFYFDEIQNIPYWEIFIRRLYNEGCKIYITGSNANLFSEELGTRLTGRYIPLQVYPFSFAEFSQEQFPLDQKNFSTTDIGRLKYLYYKYLEFGGIPMYISYKDPTYLHSLYDSILYRDIVARYKISNISAIKKLLFYLASNCGKEVSLSKLLGMINNNGKIISSNSTVSDYCSYIENSFLCYFVNKYDDNLKAQQQSPKKIYFIDHVLAKVMGFRINEDSGRLLENIVFIELKRRGYDIYYYKQSKECDFILRDGVHTLQAIQVCTELFDQITKQREILGLIDAMNYFNLSEGLIITENDDRVERVEHHNKIYTIVIIPIWKWLRAF